MEGNVILVQRYHYEDYGRIEEGGTRLYKTPSGNLPSVTTILSSTKENDHIKEWRNSVGHKEADRITEESSILGNALHENLERYILNNKRVDEGSFIARQLTTLIINKGLSKVNEVWGTEVPLYLTGLYAGTTDCVGIHEGEASIIDFKNARNFRTEDFVQDYYLQLVAYAEAHNELYGTNITKGVIMMATQTGKYQEFILEKNHYQEKRDEWFQRLYSYYEKELK